MNPLPLLVWGTVALVFSTTALVVSKTVQTVKAAL